MASDDWSAALTRRIGAEVRRLRGDRSAQWLADRTADIGMGIARPTISELETGRRKTITLQEVLVLAQALNTSPVALVYPAPYENEFVEALPGVEAVKIWAVQWFSGLFAGFTEHTDPKEHRRNTQPLRTARKITELRERKSALEQGHGRLENRDLIADLQREIDERLDSDGDD